jgi:hypothetical protein
MNQGYFKIYHFWNNKAQKVSKSFRRCQFKQDFFKQTLSLETYKVYQIGYLQGTKT